MKLNQTGHTPMAIRIITQDGAPKVNTHARTGVKTKNGLQSCQIYKDLSIERPSQGLNQHQIRPKVVCNVTLNKILIVCGGSNWHQIRPNVVCRVTLHKILRTALIWNNMMAEAKRHRLSSQKSPLKSRVTMMVNCQRDAKSRINTEQNGWRPIMRPICEVVQYANAQDRA